MEAEEGIIRSLMMATSMVVSILMTLVWLWMGIPLGGFIPMVLIASGQGILLASGGQWLATILIDWMKK